MRPSVRRSITANIFLTAWGLLTLVLFFMVFLLVFEMLQSGQRPLSSLTPQESPGQAAQAESPIFRPTTIVGERDVRLYFASAQADSLVPKRIKMEYSDSAVENCRRALELLINGPQGELTPILPETASIRALYLLSNGELVLDFGRELALEHGQFKSVSIEALMVYGVVNTLTQEALHTSNDPPLRRVRLLFDGEPPQETFPAHINVAEPLLPNMDWVTEPGGWSLND